ncbi:MAG: peptidoglycan editing factor PgeF [Bryobacteraceae bacterium]
MLFSSPPGVYQAESFQQIPWLLHGFGTRQSAGWPGRYASLKQVHSSIVVRADRHIDAAVGDAVITQEPGMIVAVRTADCVPILLVDLRRKAVAAVHAGWRGTAGEIARIAVETMEREFGSLPSELSAAIGPAIGRCCFEVGPEVAQQFRLLFPESENLRKLDLSEANRRQLVAAGIPAARIEAAPLCTKCDPERFESFRRDREKAGRMISAIGIMS